MTDLQMELEHLKQRVVLRQKTRPFDKVGNDLLMDLQRFITNWIEKH